MGVHPASTPTAQQAMAREFFGRDRAAWAEAGFAHQIRWQSAAALQRLFVAEVHERAAQVDVVGRLLAALPPAFESWSFLAQDQYLEVRTLLSGYLLSSQGDRMLMAHSVEGRFPFLDINVVALANSLSPAFKLRGLDEKHILKRAAAGLVPADIIRRSKQPFRAPDALSFTGPNPVDWVAEVISESAVSEAGVFNPAAVGQLWRKVQDWPAGKQFSNTDNMALVGVLSTGLLHERLIRSVPSRRSTVDFKTIVDRLNSSTAVGVPANAVRR